MRSGNCKECGKYFEQVGAGRPKLFCSSDCKTAWSGERISYKSDGPCSHCGKNFDKASRRAGIKYCSEYCKKQAHYKRRGDKTVSCVRCGKEFQIEKNNSRKYCASECREAAVKERRVTSSCKRCGSEFVKKARAHVFCSDDCRTTTWNERLVKVRSGHCKECGEHFEQHGPGKRQLFCTPKCCDAWRANPVNYPEMHNHTYKCQNCGKEYQTIHVDRNTYCSRECAGQWKSTVALINKAHGLANKRCISCKRMFTGLIGDSYCSDRCEERGVRRECEICGSMFYTHDFTTEGRRCSRDCQLAAKRNAMRQKAIEEGRNQGRVERIACKYCKKVFEHEIFNSVPMYCSKQCSRKQWREDNPEKAKEMRARNNHTRRARKYGNGPVENINRLDVYHRDGWICGICGKKVNPLLDSPHELSPSLDHIVPLAAGGTHTWNNVQLAHMICNSTKGSTGEGQPYLPHIMTPDSAKEALNDPQRPKRVNYG